MSRDDFPLLSFYGDDFTGSTDAMEALTLGGLRTVLFLEPPEAEGLRDRFGHLQAVGVAGVSRTMSAEKMDTELPALFRRMKRLGTAIFHYKVCSTFDSSPTIGSIGHAIDLGQEVFLSDYVPLVVGVPALRRYSLFGNLFATAGGETYRLDRHPTMRYHPVTPMLESDLRTHLSHQTKKSIVLFDILHLTGKPHEVDQRFAELLGKEPDIVLFDVLDQPRLAEVGRLIWTHRDRDSSFVVGSSGVEYALTMHWRAAGMLPNHGPEMSFTPTQQLLVVSGSCSPATQQQIRWGLEHGFAGIKLRTARLVDPNLAAAESDAVTKQALDLLAAGRSPLLYTCLGPNDPQIRETTDKLHASNLDPRNTGEYLGERLGEIVRRLLEETGVRRVAVAGGDTSGYVARHLGIFALEMLAPTAPGSPLCRAYSRRACSDGLEIVLKGGQMGGPDYFGKVLRGLS